MRAYPLPTRSRIIINVTEPVIVSSAKIEKARDGRNQQLVVEIVPFGPVTGSIASQDRDRRRRRR